MSAIRMGSIGEPPDEVPTRAVNDVSEAIVTIGTWAAVLTIIVIAVRMGLRRTSLLPPAIVAAAGVGTICEPQWNATFHLYWYSPGQINLWESYGYPQPLWVAGIYIVIYAGPALYLLTVIERGAFTREVLFRTVAVATLLIAVLEISVISSGVYAYYGSLPFRFITDYPLWVAFMEGAFIGTFAVMVARLGPLLGRGLAALAMVPIFFMTFCAVMFGGAMPAHIILNKTGMSSAAEYTGVLVALALTATMVWLAGYLLPSARPGARRLELRLVDEPPAMPAPRPRAESTT